jgi:hypothetical protein
MEMGIILEWILHKLEDARFRISAGTPATLSDIFRGVPQFLQVQYAIVAQNEAMTASSQNILNSFYANELSNRRYTF